MSAFEIVHHDEVQGKLTCFDRLIFKGHLLTLYHPGGMAAFLESQGVKLTGWKTYVRRMTETLAAHVQALAAHADRPYEYLAHNYTKATGHSKEELARDIAARDGITSGLICAFAALEPCGSFEVVGNRATHRLEVVRRRRLCRQFYLYLVDDQLGFCHIRLQSWFPFEIQIWCNGHEMLGRALDTAKVPYLRVDNAFYRIGNWHKAQTLADRIGSRRWPRLLNHLARWVNPHLPVFAKANFGGYYWVADQVEVATDIAFRTRPALENILPATFAHAASAFSAEDVLRFLGRKLTPALAAEVTTDARRRPEGWRIKHRMGRNHVKLYDKGPVLRVETTINDPDQFRVLRVKDGHRRWCPMRKSVADLYRFYQVGRASNERYLEALAAAPNNRPGVVALERLCRPRRNYGRRHPRLSPIDRRHLALFRAVLAGEHVIVGFRNTHIQNRLWAQHPIDRAEARRRCAYVSRQIAKLRGHGLIAKVPRHRLYRVTPYGQRVMSAAIAIHDHAFPSAYAAAANAA
jgi:hypothetical protein